MFLALDIGNTNVVCGVYNQKKWLHTLRIPSDMNFWDRFITLKEYAVKAASISSVYPKLTPVYLETIKNVFHLDPFIITPKNSNIKLKIKAPKEVGTDRICNTAAASELVGTPAIVGDIGSATNYDVIDKTGAFIGGAIAPGIEVASHHLIERAALLKTAAFTVPEYSIGKDTATNLQSGIMLGAIDVIDGMFNRIQKETGWKKYHVIITGGFGELISTHLKTEHKLLPNLTLDGIRLIFESNRK